VEEDSVQVQAADSAQVVLQAVEALVSHVEEVMAHAVLRRARIAQLAASDAVAVVVLDKYPTSEVVRDRTCRRRLISTWAAEAISMLFAQREISHASSPHAAC